MSLFSVFERFIERKGAEQSIIHLVWQSYGRREVRNEDRERREEGAQN